MAAPVLEFSVYGHVQIERELLRFGAVASDVSPAWRLIVGEMKEDIREQFETEGDSMSGGWPDLDEKYAARKAVHFPGQTIMRATDRLFESLTDEAGSDQTLEINPHDFLFGSKVPYGAFHMGPSKDGRPARPPVDFTAAQRRKYTKTLQAYLVGVPQI